MWPFGWYGGINNGEDVENCTPESFKFHGTFKSIARMIIRMLNTPQEWLDQLTGNLAVVRDIYYEYLELEKQKTRADIYKSDMTRFNIMSRVIPFALVVAYHDPNYREVCEWFVYRIIQEQDSMEFYPHHTCPDCWYQDGRGRAPVPMEEIEKYLQGRAPPPPGAPGNRSRCVRVNTSQCEC